MIILHKMYLFLFCLDVSGCDVTLTVTDTKQYFATEGYPYSYKDNQDCAFNFEAPAGRRIVVVFEVFNLEARFGFLYFRKFQNIYSNDNHRKTLKVHCSNINTLKIQPIQNMGSNRCKYTERTTTYINCTHHMHTCCWPIKSLCVTHGYFGQI